MNKKRVDLSFLSPTKRTSCLKSENKIPGLRNQVLILSYFKESSVEDPIFEVALEGRILIIPRSHFDPMGLSYEILPYGV